jgi:transcriptional regulator with XRE-family HTH domain
MERRKRIGANVRAEMARRGLTQEQVAPAAGLSQSKLSRRLTGRYPFMAEELDAIADLLGVEAGTFFAKV